MRVSVCDRAMLDIPCADDGRLEDVNLAQICRLCLQMDDLMISIYDRIDPNPRKRPLVDRIFELYQIQVCVCAGVSVSVCVWDHRQRTHFYFDLLKFRTKRIFAFSSSGSLLKPIRKMSTNYEITDYFMQKKILEFVGPTGVFVCD